MRRTALNPALLALEVFALILSLSLASAYVVTPSPPIVTLRPSNVPLLSPSTGLKNEVYHWRGQEIRYLASGPADAKKSVLLVHGLFVNADHWRRTINDLGSAGYRTYAIDLLGSGYSSKPSSDSPEAMALNGETGRFLTTPYVDHLGNQMSEKKLQPPIRENVVLGTASGGRRVAKQMDMRHPTNSCYNFYTWAEQLSDFTQDIIFQGNEFWSDGTHKTTSLVANSKGTIAALQAVLDTPEQYNGVCSINPTYREMHQAEMRFPAITMPILNLVQKFLRSSKGKELYNIATQRDCIKSILQEPYYNVDAIDDELVTALMEPLKIPGAAEVVFDELSYTTGPLFEQLLQDINGRKTSRRKNVWVCYGEKDPWLSPKRVESLVATPFSNEGVPVVDEVIAIANAGHCPHDERPEIMNPIILDFLQSC